MERMSGSLSSSVTAAPDALGGVGGLAGTKKDGTDATVACTRQTSVGRDAPVPRLVLGAQSAVDLR